MALTVASTGLQLALRRVRAGTVDTARSGANPAHPGPGVRSGAGDVPRGRGRLPYGDDIEIVAVADAMLLSDGRVGAFVVERSGDTTLTPYAVFEQQDGQGLVDEVIEFTSPDDGE